MSGARSVLAWLLSAGQPPWLTAPAAEAHALRGVRADVLCTKLSGVLGQVEEPHYLPLGDLDGIRLPRPRRRPPAGRPESRCMATGGCFEVSGGCSDERVGAVSRERELRSSPARVAWRRFARSSSRLNWGAPLWIIEIYDGNVDAGQILCC
jgi:hypothetical protein